MLFWHKAVKFGLMSGTDCWPFEKLLLTNFGGIRKQSSALECGCLWFLRDPQTGEGWGEFVSANWGKANPHNGCIGLVACSGGAHTAGCDATAEPRWIFSEGAEVTYITLKFDLHLVVSVFACAFWQESQCTGNLNRQHTFFLLKGIRINVNWNVTLALSADSDVLCVFTLQCRFQFKCKAWCCYCQIYFWLLTFNPKQKRFQMQSVVSQHSGEQEDQWANSFIVDHQLTRKDDEEILCSYPEKRN